VIISPGLFFIICTEKDRSSEGNEEESAMFTISPEAGEYIRKKGGVLTLFMETNHSTGG